MREEGRGRHPGEKEREGRERVEGRRKEGGGEVSSKFVASGLRMKARETPRYRGWRFLGSEVRRSICVLQ